MRYILKVSDDARQTLLRLEMENSKKLARIRKTLVLIETDLRNRSLQTHKYDAIKGPNGEEAFEAYVENNTPGAYRVFWHYGPGRGIISIIAITPHP